MNPEPLLRPAEPEHTVRLNRAMLLALLPCLALWAIVAVAVDPYLPTPADGDPTMRRVFAGVIGMIGGLGMHRFFTMLFGWGRGPGSRRAIFARARSDAPPEDGRLMIATGVVRCDRPLTSPLTGVPCAAYDYNMFLRTHEGLRTQHDRVVYSGYAAQPFSIESPSRSYPVSGVTMPAEKPTLLDSEAVFTRARNFVRSTSWEDIEYPKLEVIEAWFHRTGDTSTTGSRRDFALQNDVAPDVVLLRFEESVLPIGATVSALGNWSASRGAIVRPPDSPDGLVVVAQGGPEALGDRRGLPEAMDQSVSSAIIATVLAIGAFFLARLILPNIKS